MEAAPENDKELSNSAHANGINEWMLLRAEIGIFTNLDMWVLTRNTVMKVTYRTSEREVMCFEMY